LVEDLECQGDGLLISFRLTGGNLSFFQFRWGLACS